VIIIPAVDIRQGKCVRLRQGRADEETVFSNDPAAMALRWAEMGAQLVHVIDLDGAFDQRPKNRQAVKKIVDTIDVPIQVGGGIRDMETIREYMALGVGKVIIGTEAIKNPDLVKQAARDFPDQVVVGIDARNGKVAIEGWTETTGVSAIDLAKKFVDCGVSAINFTDIHRDGMQTGPNIEQTQSLAEAITVPVVASGGVSTLADIENLLPLEAVGVTGVITGKALYSGSLDLKAAIALTQKTE
jgi:phosphoribosylformimino-5-aminoimidazole carboxamide ribotide isomerase